MRCVRCGSHRIIEFVDGFGKERVFCRDCFISLEKTSFIKLSSQRTLREFYLSEILRWNTKL
ncbi:MAG: hypothetical protein QXP34_00990 [Candidatus Aenigmatarchaeota archaeon]